MDAAADSRITAIVAALNAAGDDWPAAIRRDHEAVTVGVEAALHARGIDPDTAWSEWGPAYDELAPTVGVGLAGLQIDHGGDVHTRAHVHTPRLRNDLGQPVRLYRHDTDGWSVLGWSDAARARQLPRDLHTAAAVIADLYGPGDDD